MNSVHDKFVMSVQCMESRYKVFDVMAEWIEHLKNSTNAELTQLDLDTPMDVLREVQEIFKTEQETWSLLLLLYYFRLAERSEDVMTVDTPAVDPSDELPAVKRIIENDRSVKEVTHILEWLESNAAKQQEPDLLEKFVSWEQTLETLKRDNKLGVNLAKPMITTMDPDACHREGKEIHPFDTEDEMKVLKALFFYVRSGQCEKAVEYLYESGHMARAAMFNGVWYTEKIPLNLEGNNFHSEDMESDIDGGIANDTLTQRPLDPNAEQGFAILGNTERDMWKNIAFTICEENELPNYERAALGAMCGHRKSMLDVAVCWEDKLWAYLKTLLDLRIESELRRLKSESPIPLPDEYWNQDCSLTECLDQIQLKDAENGKLYKKIFVSVQKYVITDNIDGLLNSLREAVTQILEQAEYSVVTGHLLRFVTHLLLALGIVGLPFQEDLMNICTEAYIKVLVREDKLIFTPFYVDKLSSDRQIRIIAEQIRPEEQSKRDAIKYFMQASHVNNLDVLNIAIAIVTKLRDEQEDFDVESLFWITSCYQLVPDSRDVMLAFIRNSLIITRKYLILRNISKCNQLIRQIDDGCMSEVVSISEEYEDTIVRECLCYKAYLEAEDAFLLWERSIRQKPKAEAYDMEASFQEFSVADRTLREKKRSDLKISEEKWQKAVNHHLKNCIDKFFTVLKFPNGWLVDCVTPTNEDEFNSVKAVRRIILPKVVFVLLKLITDQKSLKTMRKFVYTLCEDHREILKEFTTAEIISIFKTVEEFIRQSSKSLAQLPK